MQTTSFKSAPSANAELATANLNAILGQAGGNGNVKVINTGVQEVDGVWIATAFVEIEEPEPENKKEDEEKMSVQDRPEADPERPEDGIVHIAYLDGYKPSVTDQSIPVEPEDALNAELEPPLMEPTVVEAADKPEDIPTAAETLGGSADDMAEMVIADFNGPDVITTASAAHTPNVTPQAPAPLDLTEEERQAVLEAREKAKEQDLENLEEPTPTPPNG